MKFLIIFFFLFMTSSLFSQTSLDTIRLNYTTAVTDKNTCKKMIDELQSKPNNPVYLGYLGGFQAIWANHVFSPISKLKTFNKGKSNLEKSILQDPNNSELRYIRLSIQKNVPTILGYNNMIESDTEFLQLHKKNIASKLVLKNIELLLQL